MPTPSIPQIVLPEALSTVSGSLVVEWEESVHGVPDAPTNFALVEGELEVVPDAPTNFTIEEVV